MRPSLCRSCLASLSKLLNFLQTLVGVSIVLYSAWILNHLRKGKLGEGVGFDLDKLSAPRLVCALMGIGIPVCLIVFTGHVAAKAISSCCLCFVLSLLLAMILRAMVPRKRLDYDTDEDFVVIRRPLLNPQSGSSFTATTIDVKGHHTDIWSSQIRQKYGLNQN